MNPADRIVELSRRIARLARGVGEPLDSLFSADNRERRHVDHRVEAAQVRRVIRARRRRERLFGRDLFSDPSWDVLLDLYAAELEGARVSVSSACIAAAVSSTTALRHLRILELAGIVVRERDPLDGRRSFLRLTGQARLTMARYFASPEQEAA